MTVVNHHSDSETMSANHPSFITLLCSIITTLCEGRKWADVIAWAIVGVCASISVNEISFVGSAHMKTHICVFITSVGENMSVLPSVYKQRRGCARVLCVFVVLIWGGDFFSSPRTQTRRPSCRSRWQAGGTSCTFACAGRECSGSSCSVDRTHKGRA